MVAGITQATEYLDSLIGDLQAATLYSAHSLRPADVDATLEQVASFARASHRDVRFVLPIPTGITLQIEQTQLLRCLWNLATNAAEAAAAGSSEERIVEFVITQTPEHLGIQILDSGNGFPQENPMSAFHAYVSQRPETSGHSGLGLYIVRSIVEQAGGRVSITRMESRTVVCVDFPLHLVSVAKR